MTGGGVETLAIGIRAHVSIRSCQVRMSVADVGDGRTAGQHRGEGSSPCQAVVHDRSPHVRQVTTDLAATLDLAGHRGAGTPDRHARLAA
jgi:hypothetical protein